MTTEEKLQIAIKAMRQSLGAFYSDYSGAAEQKRIIVDALAALGETIRETDK